MEYARQDLADELLRLLSAGEDEPILFAAIVGSVEGFVSSTPREGRSTRYADIDAYLIIRESDSGQVLSILRQAHSKLAERFPEAVFLGGFVRSYRNQSGPPGARASKALASDGIFASVHGPFDPDPGVLTREELLSERPVVFLHWIMETEASFVGIPCSQFVLATMDDKARFAHLSKGFAPSLAEAYKKMHGVTLHPSEVDFLFNPLKDADQKRLFTYNAPHVIRELARLQAAVNEERPFYGNRYVTWFEEEAGNQRHTSEQTSLEFTLYQSVQYGLKLCLTLGTTLHRYVQSPPEIERDKDLKHLCDLSEAKGVRTSLWLLRKVAWDPATATVWQKTPDGRQLKMDFVTLADRLIQQFSQRLLGAQSKIPRAFPIRPSAALRWMDSMPSGGRREFMVLKNYRGLFAKVLKGAYEQSDGPQELGDEIASRDWRALSQVDFETHLKPYIAARADRAPRRRLLKSLLEGPFSNESEIARQVITVSDQLLLVRWILSEIADEQLTKIVRDWYDACIRSRLVENPIGFLKLLRERRERVRHSAFQYAMKLDLSAVATNDSRDVTFTLVNVLRLERILRSGKAVSQTGHTDTHTLLDRGDLHIRDAEFFGAVRKCITIVLEEECRLELPDCEGGQVNPMDILAIAAPIWRLLRVAEGCADAQSDISRTKEDGSEMDAYDCQMLLTLYLVHLNLQFSGETSERSGKQTFRVALSFPGERRTYVEEVAELLRSHFGKDAIFYDNWYVHRLAKADLDITLQDIYQSAELVVVFLCSEYEAKQWCGLEWRAIRDLLKRREGQRVMFVRFDRTEVRGVFSIDGYLDAASHPPVWVADKITKRLQEGAL